MLRDPLRFRQLYRRKMQELLAEMGYPPDSDHDMEPEKQKALMIQVEQALSDEQINSADLAELRGCARIFIDKRCNWTIWEYQNYQAAKRRIANRNLTEDPADYANHIMDAKGYYFWQYKRWGMGPAGPDESYLGLADGPLPALPAPVEGVDREDGPPLPDHNLRAQAWLAEMRTQYDRDQSGTRSLLRAC